MNNMKNKRLIREFQAFDNQSVFKLINLNNLSVKIEFKGPVDSPYENLNLSVNILYHSAHPFRAPKIFFAPSILHPNVNEYGELIVGSLTGSEWSPALTTHQAMMTILSLLYEPFICDINLKKNDKGKEEETEEANDECVNMEALKLWRESSDSYREIVLLSYLE